MCSMKSIYFIARTLPTFSFTIGIPFMLSNPEGRRSWFEFLLAYLPLCRSMTRQNLISQCISSAIRHLTNKLLVEQTAALSTQAACSRIFPPLSRVTVFHDGFYEGVWA